MAGGSRLLNLPPELRDYIWSYAAGGHPRYIVPDKTSDITGMLCSCRQIQREMLRHCIPPGGAIQNLTVRFVPNCMSTSVTFQADWRRGQESHIIKWSWPLPLPTSEDDPITPLIRYVACLSLELAPMHCRRCDGTRCFLSMYAMFKKVLQRLRSVVKIKSVAVRFLPVGGQQRVKLQTAYWNRQLPGSIIMHEPNRVYYYEYILLHLALFMRRRQSTLKLSFLDETPAPSTFQVISWDFIIRGVVTGPVPLAAYIESIANSPIPSWRWRLEGTREHTREFRKLRRRVGVLDAWMAALRVMPRLYLLTASESLTALPTAMATTRRPHVLSWVKMPGLSGWELHELWRPGD
ncbi:hypothetical protein GQ53DRAFT_181010 [Thozetella sp. PMI_491]|nr:hypothetical protein GQ53DRAFT_181010 [Thozetella sp. PMI_491]